MTIEQIKIKPGVYLIYDSVDKKSYIGSSRDVRRRIQCHFSMLHRNKHECPEMQQCFNKNKKFSFKILQYLESQDREELLACEQKWIQKFHADGRKLFNKALNPTHGVSGYKHPEQSIARHSKASKMNWENKILRKKMCDKIKKSWENPKIRQKKCDAIKKACQSLEFRKKKSIAAKNQWQQIEYRQKMSDIKKGDGNPNCKLKLCMIDEIKELYNSQKMKIVDIAKLYNVHPETMRVFIKKHIFLETLA